MPSKEKFSSERLQQQAEFLDDLVHFRGNLKEILSRDLYGPVVNEFVHNFPEDFYLAVLKKEHLISVFERYKKGELTKNDVYWWGEALSYRDDVDYEPDYDEAISAVINELIIYRVEDMELTETDIHTFLNMLQQKNT